MKKLVLSIAALALVATTLTSCKKDYDCVCTLGSDTETFKLKDVKKKDADAACNSVGTFYTLAGGTCSIK